MMREAQPDLSAHTPGTQHEGSQVQAPLVPQRPRMIERCGAKEASWPCVTPERHLCLLDAGHSGPHVCVCRASWYSDDNGGRVVVTRGGSVGPGAMGALWKTVLQRRAQDAKDHQDQAPASA
jgi:hypothetical protein